MNAREHRIERVKYANRLVFAAKQGGVPPASATRLRKAVASCAPASQRNAPPHSMSSAAPGFMTGVVEGTDRRHNTGAEKNALR